MKFDGYGATIRGDVTHSYVAHALAERLDGIACKGKPIRRYGDTLNIDMGNRMAAWIGQDSTTGHIYVEGKGETSPVLVEAIRELFPSHTAPRIDVCEDYSNPGAFEQLQAVIRGHKGARVKGGYVALPDNVEDGRTWAAGVRGGVGYLRLYEAGKHPDRLHLAMPDWVRAELECRPHYAKDKAAAARMSPAEVWGMSSWTHSVGQALTQSELPRYQPEAREFSHDKTVLYLATKFRRCLETMLEDGLHLESTFRQIWQENDDLKRRGML